MIKNTDLLYQRAREYQDKRDRLMEEYATSVKSLERFAGSQGYEDDVLHLKNKFEADMKSLYEEYQPGMMTVLGGMMDSVGNRGMDAPTNEQVNILNVLKMRRKVTVEECRRVAMAVKDNPLALKIVTEIAHDHGIPHSFDDMCPEMSSERALKVVDTLRSSVDDFLNHTTTRASRVAKRYYTERYGDFDGGLTERKRFNSKEEFYSSMGISGDVMQQFEGIVDA